MGKGQNERGRRDEILRCAQNDRWVRLPRTGYAAILTDVVDYEIIIELEVHAQLLTGSKMFCSCSADYASAPPKP